MFSYFCAFWHVLCKQPVMGLFFFFFLRFSLFIHSLLTVLGPNCYMQAFSSCGEQGSLLVLGHRLLIVAVSLVAECGLSACRLQQLQLMHGLRRCGACPVPCGIIPDQGSHPCPPHWQADS